jgi:hypothetical protein
MVIDELKDTISGPNSPVAFVYCDYQDQDNQTSSNMIASILRQLVAINPVFPKCVVDACEKHHGSGSSFALEELERTTLDVIKTIQRPDIVIDALDECDELKHRRAVLQFLDQLKRIETVHLFVTSRQHIHDINSSFHTYPRIEIKAHNIDLQRYVYQEIEHAGFMTFLTRICCDDC